MREDEQRRCYREVSMPVVQPADLWQESGRWEQYGPPELLRFVDRSERPFVPARPTKKLAITDLVRTNSALISSCR